MRGHAGSRQRQARSSAAGQAQGPCPPADCKTRPGTEPPRCTSAGPLGWACRHAPKRTRGSGSAAVVAVPHRLHTLQNNQTVPHDPALRACKSMTIPPISTTGPAPAAPSAAAVAAQGCCSHAAFDRFS